MSEVFKKLNAVDVSKRIEKKSGLSYLSWAWAWGEVKKIYPTATYEVQRFDGIPYLFDENLGYSVFTKVTIEGETLEMWLPVMDGANKAMKDKPYTYQVKDWNASKQQGKDVFKDKKVSSATMFDINKTTMRCLVKNIGMFGLGLYIYAGEDLPEPPEKEEADENVLDSLKTKTFKQAFGALGKYKLDEQQTEDAIKILLDLVSSRAEFVQLWSATGNDLHESLKEDFAKVGVKYPKNK